VPALSNLIEHPARAFYLIVYYEYIDTVSVCAHLVFILSLSCFWASLTSVFVYLGTSGLLFAFWKLLSVFCLLSSVFVESV
jgi:hypothetical protein